MKSKLSGWSIALSLFGALFVGGSVIFLLIELTNSGYRRDSFNLLVSISLLGASLGFYFLSAFCRAISNMEEDIEAIRDSIKTIEMAGSKAESESTNHNTGMPGINDKQNQNNEHHINSEANTENKSVAALAVPNSLHDKNMGSSK